jgi:hypothetical protein
MSKTLFKRRGLALLAAFAAVAAIAAYSVAAASADGRTPVGSFCSHAVTGSPFPPGLCIQAMFNGESVQGYFGSPGQVSIRPGNYWLAVTDNSNFHNFTLRGPNGVDTDITPVPNGSTAVITQTVKLHLSHGSYTLLCKATGHAAAGMEINIDVGGVGQVG